MSTRALSRAGKLSPALMEDFFKPWNEWFDMESMGNMSNIPAVNIQEDKDAFKVDMAVPGKKKEDFRIVVEGDMLVISCRQEDKKEEKTVKYTRKEFSYTSFTRSFSLPADIDRNKIDAHYESGVLQVVLPKKEALKNAARHQQIIVK